MNCTNMIDLESCYDDEFKRWVLANNLRWIRPDELRQTLTEIQRHGITLIGYRQDRRFADFYHRLPHVRVEAMYQYDRALGGPDPTTEWHSLSDKMLASVLGINGTQFQTELRQREEVHPVYYRNRNFDFQCKQSLVEITIRFIVLNYGDSHRTAPGIWNHVWDHDVRGFQAGRDGDDTLLARLHPQAA